MEVTFLVGDLCCRGQVESGPTSRGYWGEPQSHAWVCPVCARVWATASVPGTLYLIYRTNCPKHPTKSFYMPAGTMWLPLEVELMKAMPRPLLEREFWLHLENAERFGHIQQLA